MNTIVSEITVDLMKPTETPVIHAVQGERESRIVKLTLLADGSPWLLPEGVLLTVRYGRNALSGGYYDTLPDGTPACSYEGNIITIVLAPQMMAQAGAVLAQVELQHEEQLLATFSFRMMVELNPAVGIVQPENYINWLQWMQEQLRIYTNQIITDGDFTGPAGPAGPIGAPARLLGSSVVYQGSASGTKIPTGSWSTNVPVVAQGNYLWTRVTSTFNTGDPVVSYTVSRMGLDGTGSVSSVADVSPDENGNVPLTADHLGALPVSGGVMTGPIDMNGQSVDGLNAPTQETEATNKGYVDQLFQKAAPRNLLDNSNFKNPVNQRGQSNYAGAVYGIDRWKGYGESCAVNVANGYIEIVQNPASAATTKLWVQQIPVNENMRGKTVTLAAKIRGGSVRLNFNNTTIGTYVASDDWYVHVNRAVIPENADTFFVGLQSRYTTDFQCEWIALYEGEYTAETLPAYQPKSYAAELLECQRYYVNFGDMIFRSSMSEDSIHNITIMFPVPMRIIPTISATAVEGEVPETASVTKRGIAYSVYGAKYTLQYISASADL